jgi:hypothetical protein
MPSDKMFNSQDNFSFTKSALTTFKVVLCLTRKVCTLLQTILKQKINFQLVERDFHNKTCFNPCNRLFTLVIELTVANRLLNSTFNYFSFRIEDDNVKGEKCEGESHPKLSLESEDEIEDKVTTWVRKYP